MGEKIVVGPINKGLKLDRTPFTIDNDSFPQLENAYQWRGRVKRKRGTEFLGRLTRGIASVSQGTTDGAGAFTGNIFSSISLKGNITGVTQANPGSVTSVGHNLTTGTSVQISGVSGMTQLNGNSYTITNTGANTFTIGVSTIAFNAYISGGLWENNTQPNASIVPSTVSIAVAAQTFTDNGSGVLSNGAGGLGTINYSTGAITLQTAPVLAANAITASFSYYPTLPVMGLEDLVLDPSNFPGTIPFDTKYAYNLSTTSPYPVYSVSFYKNVATATYTGYTAKGTWTPTIWNGQDYQQFWTTNFQGAMWATNGINVPFSVTNIGMQYNTITVVDNITAGPPALADLTFAVAHGLVVGDFLFVNEVVTTTGINFQTGYVTVEVSTTKVTVEFQNATIATNGTGGIAQYLTNRFDATKDCLRWYDGDPTGGSPPTPTATKGWVNFAPPLSQLSYSISDLPLAKYYLVGARLILPFKDRLVFFGPVVQTSAAGSQIYLPDTVIYSQNGTAFYTCSFPYATANPVAGIATTAILVPTNQTATYSAYWEDQTGFGGFQQVGLAQPINTVSGNEDVLILGMSTKQVRMVYSGNDIVPFNFYTISSELGSESTFSAVNLDRGVLTVGSRGLIISAQNEAQRFDNEIPDQVFQINLTSNGSQRVCSQRDFINEWIYFTYRANEDDPYVFPNQTLQYNYRDGSWAIFDEAYTNYGTFRKTTGETWATIGNSYATWAEWNDLWDSGSSTLQQPEVIGGNQQGFVLIRGIGTGEGKSLQIKSISGSVVTSPNHTLNTGDYITISGCIGTMSAQLNGKVFSVVSPGVSTFTLKPTIGSGTYLGGGVITRMYVPYIQSKQFPVSWGMGRKTRLGVQQYLLTKTAQSQVTLLIFLSENGASGYNEGSIVPTSIPAPVNNSLLYSTVLYTCTESENIGLTAANTNLQMITPNAGAQIWHRINTSLIGDTVQVGITMSDPQMREQSAIDTATAITGATQAYPCVLTTTAAYTAGQMIKIENIVGMVQLNFNAATYNYYYVLSSTSSTVTIDVNSSAFAAYVSGGTATPVAQLNQFAEIEFHGCILDVNPSSVLA